MKSPLVTITASELEADPGARLWALILYLAERPELHNTAEFRKFWLAYVYDAEVKNGGHLQYFHNRGTQAVAATLAALHKIGAHDQAEILADCWSQVKRYPISRVSSLEKYSSLAAECSFSAEDSAYFQVKPDVFSLLESHYESLLVQSVTVDA
jgi:hypothetical protein